MITLERAVFNTEEYLSKASVYPVIGTVAGTAKIAMGTLQLASALALGIFSAFSVIISPRENPAKNKLKFSCRHVVHGVSNVIAGILETIPLLQSVFYGFRDLKQTVGSYLPTKICSGQESRFIGYKLLAKEDSIAYSCHGWFINNRCIRKITIDQAKKWKIYQQLRKERGYPWTMV